MVTKKQSRPNIFRADCLSRETLQLIADEWTPLVVYASEEGTMRDRTVSASLLMRKLAAYPRQNQVERRIDRVWQA